MYYLYKDHLGSITAIANQSGTIEYHSFDAWERLRNPSNWTFNNIPAMTILDRGYTGHEHLADYGLINMNGRMYDPIIGQMLSPDPYVQDIAGSQGFNRYSYCMNNPLKYTDPSGEFVFGLTLFIRNLAFASLVGNAVKSLTKTVFSGGLEFWNWGQDYTKNAWRNGWQATENSMKLTLGLFNTDPNRKNAYRGWELITRFTWQAPQTLAGYTVTQSHNFFNGIKDVHYYGGATVARTYSSGWGAVTLGSFIMGSSNISANPNNSLFQHEYGHYLQSQASGPFYLQRYGIPSALSRGNHDYHPVEQDANARALKYFNQHVNGYNNWRFDVNPIIGYNENLPFDNASNQSALKHARLRTAWYDWTLGPNILFNGIINTLILNNRDRYDSKLRELYNEGLPIGTGAWDRF